MNDSFRCLLVEAKAGADGPRVPTPEWQSTTAQVQTLAVDQLPPGEVTIQVAFSSLNYKDALAVQGHRGVIKRLPHIPGIDAAGTIVASDCSRFTVGDAVLVTGYDLGQGHWGGWSELIRVPADWVVPLPPALTARQAMALGTAGFTAAQCVLAIRGAGVEPDAGEIVVTGATGGVGSWAVRLLAHLGYQVVAVTGKTEQYAWLQGLGAKRVLNRDQVLGDPQRPMLSAQWAAAVDTVGGNLLNSLLRSVQYGGCVTACGLVAGAELNMTLYPFLLRGVSLCGIASADCPDVRRRDIWDLLANDWQLPDIDDFVTQVRLDELPERVAGILAGQNIGRVVIQL
ncbi:MAG: YhdH/YhfP family quinone oxidoreductase [Pirellulaceae bacterium]